MLDMTVVYAAPDGLVTRIMIEGGTVVQPTCNKWEFPRTLWVVGLETSVG